jgi:altronate dehydratase large subunit
MSMQGWLRSDGRKGIRNVVVVGNLVECAHHVAREIALPLREEGVHVIGFPGCYRNGYAERMLRQRMVQPTGIAVSVRRAQ